MNNKLQALFIVFALFASAFYANAQSDVKTTEIWLVDMSSKDGQFTFGPPVKITDNTYYDNQPCFSDDGRFVYFVSMPDTPQTDIFEYDTKTKFTRRITNTPESEYQPQPIIGKKRLLSVVRVDEEKAQGFYSVNMDGTEILNISENSDSIAYYAWLNDSTVGMYVLDGDFPMLLQFEMPIQQSIVITEGGSFGRCLQKIPGSADLSYVDKNDKKNWLLYNFSFEKEDTLFICKMIEGEEDYCWAPGRYIFMGSKGKLFMYDPEMHNKASWKMVADFTKTIGNFYRIACSPTGNRLAIVSYSGTKP